MESCHSLLERGGELEVRMSNSDPEKEQIYFELQKDTQQQQVGKKFIRHILCGLLWISGGGLAVALSIHDAKAGITPYLFSAAVVFGMFGFIKGLIGWTKVRNRA